MTESQLSGMPGFMRDLARRFPWAWETLTDLEQVVMKLKTLPHLVAALVIVVLMLTCLSRFALFLMIGLGLGVGWLLDHLLSQSPQAPSGAVGGGTSSPGGVS